MFTHNYIVVLLTSYIPLVQTQSLTIQPGDVLLIPAGWWHAVESSSVSVSLSVRYMDAVENAVNYVDRWKEYVTPHT